MPCICSKNESVETVLKQIDYIFVSPFFPPNMRSFFFYSPNCEKSIEMCWGSKRLVWPEQPDLYRPWGGQTNTAKCYDVATLVWYCKISLKEYIPATKTLTSSCILTIFDIDLDFVSLCFPSMLLIMPKHTIYLGIEWLPVWQEPAFMVMQPFSDFPSVPEFARLRK